MVRNIWVEVTDAGEFVVVEVQGVRADGSYWVNGFQVRFSRLEWDSLTADQIAARLNLEARKQEDLITKWQNQQLASQQKTDLLRADAKYSGLVGREVWRRTVTATQ